MTRRSLIHGAMGLATLLVEGFGGILLKVAPPDTTEGAYFGLCFALFGVFLVYLIVAATVKELPVQEHRVRWYKKGVGAACVTGVLAILYIAAFLFFTTANPNDGGDRRYVTGFWLTQEAKDTLDKKSEWNSRDLVREGHVQNITDIWPRSSRTAAAILLVSLFAFLNIGLGLTVFSLAEVILLGQGGSAGEPSTTDP